MCRDKLLIFCLSRQRHRHHRTPVEQRSENDVDVPDAMIVRMLRLLVVHEEIDARRVGHTLHQNQRDGAQVDAFAHRRDDVED